MNRKPNSAFAVINYGKTMHVCMDIHCPCGYHNHLDTWGDMGSAEYVRCADCKDVLRIGADVNLLDKQEDFSIDHGAHVFIQWKGTDVVMQAHCTCGKTFDIERDFAYECDCPHCGKHYHCESCLEVTRLTPEEAALVTHVQEPEKDYEDMNDEERAAYDAKMESQAVEQAGERLRLLAGLKELACCEPGRLVAVPDIMQPVHMFEVPLVTQPSAGYLGAMLVAEALRKAPPLPVVLAGDFIGEPPAMPDLMGKRVFVVPDVHVGLPLREPGEVMSGDLSDLFALSRWPGNGAGGRKQRRQNRRRKKQ